MKNFVMKEMSGACRVIIIAFVFIAGFTAAMHAATVTSGSITIAPSTVAAGANMSVNFTYTLAGNNDTLGYFVAFRTGSTCSLPTAGAGTDIKVSESGKNILCQGCNVNGGRDLGCGSQCTSGTSYPISGIEGGPLTLTVPVTYAPGTYTLIVCVKEWNVYMNPGNNADSYACLTFTVSAAATPTPTGVQNQANSDSNTTNAVGLIIFSPTRTITQTVTISPTLSWTLTTTMSPTLTPTLTWTLSPTLTSTLTWTLTPTLTSTPTPPLIISLTKTEDATIVSLGDTVNYCLIYQNNSSVPESFTIWDTIPAVTDFVSCTNGCTQQTFGSNRLVIWTLTNVGVGVQNEVCFAVQVNRMPTMLPWKKEFFALLDEREKYAAIMAGVKQEHIGEFGF
jgi:uncharacterized repeat protein (TIGR01451 family)